MSAHGHRYQPSWCEENVWHLAQKAVLSDEVEDPFVVFISSPSRSVGVWEQRAGSPVVWDYHVVLLGRVDETWIVWDLDCTAGFPLSARGWAIASFPFAGAIPLELEPRFRLVDAASFLADFRSDRSHMRLGEQWRAKPPPWEAISADESNLWDYVDMVRPEPGEVVDLDEFLRRYG